MARMSIQLSFSRTVNRFTAAGMCVLAAAIALPQLAFALVDPPPSDCERYPPGPHVQPPDTSCPTDPYAEGYGSKCWYSSVDLTQWPSQWPPLTGFPLNINLWQGPGPSDFPPRSLHPILGSLPLVPNETSLHAGFSPYRERPTHHGIVDLITGAPLVQDIDFELPFGSAVFRHVRTYSEPASKLTWNALGVGDGELHPATGAFWDWNGLFWMMGENPILLIDAAYPDISHEDVRRCYFVPDAHHAIPFLLNEDTGQYAAPPWFDAIMAHDGSYSEGEWNPRPTEYRIWLNRRSVEYVIRPYYQDHWVFVHDGGMPNCPMQTADIHDPAECPEHAREYPNGIPYYGLVTEIRDRQGNRAVIDYCEFHQADGCDISGSTSCDACCQNCNEKGQIRSVKLVAPDDSVVWTLVYTHRGFRADSNDIHLPPDPEELREQRTSHALHSIHVYEGDLDLSGAPACLTIPAAEFCSAENLDEIDAIDHDFVLARPQWVIAAKYLYSEEVWDDEDPATNTQCPGGLLPSADIMWRTGKDGTNRYVRAGHRLLKTTVTRQDPADENAPQDVRYWMYRYGPRWMLDFTNLYRCLRAAYSPTTTQNILDAYHALCENCSVNSLLLSDDGAIVPFVNPETGLPAPMSLIKAADFRMSHWPGADWQANGLGDHLATNYLSGADTARTTTVIGGCERLIDRRGVEDDDGEFVYYYFRRYPENAIPPEGIECGPSDWISPDPLSCHYPFRFTFPAQCYLPDRSPKSSDLSEPFWITVIDKITSPTAYSPAADLGLLYRRVVEMNPAGFVLSDKTWHFEPGQGPNPSIAQLLVYDDKGRVIERRSKGWASVANTTPDTSGLIHVYAYHDDGPDGRLGELKAVGIKQGVQGQVYWLSRNSRHEDRPELITEETVFPTPTTDLESEGETTLVQYEFVDIAESTAWLRPIASKAIVQPPSPYTAGGTAYHAFDMTSYDANGNPAWSAVGSAAGVESLDDPYRSYVTSYVHDQYGQLYRKEEDTTETEMPRQPDPEAGDPLAYVTQHHYSGAYGLERTIQPNGREQHILYVAPSDNSGIGLERRLYNEVTPYAGPSGQFTVGGPVEVSRIIGGKLQWVQRGTLSGTIGSTPTGHETFEPFATATPNYDTSGRLVGVRQQGQDDPSSVSSAVQYNGFGQIGRQRESDGTITRHEYDALGRLIRTYRGTRDAHPHWGAPPNQQPNDNMVLVEKRYYGEGVTDAGLLREVRYYRNKPVNQYFDEEGDPPPENNEDEIGWRTIHEYDWRMREVCVTTMVADSPGSQQQPAVRITLTWFDHQSRPRFVAEYAGDATIPEAADPRLAGPPDSPPAPSAFLAPGLLSLTETVYNARGLAEEVRRYAIPTDDPPPPTGLPYTATKTYYDFAGRPVEVHSPGAPIQQYVCDGRGRQVISRSIAAGVEITRTETTYDADDRAIKTVHYERRHDATGETLSAENAIRTFTYTWYDTAGRVIGVVNFGTYGSHFANGESEPPPREDMNEPNRYNEDGDLIDCTCSSSAGVIEGDVLATCYEYDDGGRQSLIIHPDGRHTRSEYNQLGLLMLTIENAADDPAVRQITAYRYECQDVTAATCTGTRVVKMAAVLPGHNGGNGVTEYAEIDWNADDGTLQVTELIYNADVVEASGGTAVSAHGAWISEVHYPDPATGQPAAEPAFAFQYTIDGLVAARRDARGVRFEHVYDELGRRIETTIDDSEWYPAPVPGTLDFRPPDRISRILYDYRPNGQLDSVLAWRQTFSGEAIVAQNYFAYDEHDNLTQEYQLHAGPLEAYGHVVDYAWIYSPDPGAGGGGYNFNRLASITYPAWCNTTGQGPTGGGRRTVTLHYGNDEGDVDSALGCVTRIEDSEFGDVASFSYMGLSRRIGRTWGPAAAAIVSLALLDPAAAGLDRFGRVSDLHFTLGPAAGAAEGQTVHRYQYGYDLAGNRTFARVTHADTPAGAWGNGQPSSATPHINDRSWLYAYDGLHRLVDAQMGSLSTDNDAILTGGTSLPGGGTAPVPRSTQWFLDNLGNWSAGDVPGPGLPPESVIRSEDTDGDGTAETFTLHHDVDLRNRLTQVTADGTDARAMVQDPAGNLVSDGVYFFEFDAFNRLVQVSEVGTLEFHPDDGRVVDGAAGDLVARYQYDGLGRLIAKTTPIVEGVVSGQYQPTLLQRKDFYYDGVRRIQEVITRYYAPLLSSANDELPEIIGEGEPEPEPEPGPAPLIWTDREYVYGPDDADEFVAQIDRDARPMLVVQDGNLNVVALLAGADDVFFDAGTNGLPAGSVLAQYVYDPYGGVVFQESFAEHAVNRVGHQGLFFDRFDGTADDSSLTREAQGVYYNRNRVYSPTLGRFLTADPNETALTLVSALAMNGQSLGGPDSGGFNLEGHYGDGFNLYQYLGSNPVNSRDPLGLDVWDDFDDAISDWMGHRVASMGYIHEGSGWAIAGMNTALDVAGSFLGVDLIDSVGAILSNQAGFWDYIEVGIAAAPFAGRLAQFGYKALLKGHGWMGRFAKTGRMRNSSLTAKFGCFVGGTLVVMADASLQPIEAIRPDDWVLCEQDYHEDGQCATARVVRTFKRTVPGVLELIVQCDDEIFSILTTPEHPFYDNDQQAFVPAAQLVPGSCLFDANGRACTALALAAHVQPTVVYNIEVEHAHNYFVALGRDYRVLVHNNPCAKGLLAFTYSNFRENLIRYTGIDPGIGIHAHHIFPSSLAPKFAQLGINVHHPRYGLWWPAQEHLAKATAYNQAWHIWFKRTKYPSMEAALEHAKTLSRQFGFHGQFGL